MAKNKGRGSILLKLLIAVLIIVLIAVITIPAKIWDTEAYDKKTAQGNMTSIYEAENFYHRINDTYTTDPAELLKVVRQDSSLIRLQQVVNYTNELASLIDNYKKIPMIKNLVVISENIDQVREDLETNKRNFRILEDIKNEAEDLKIQISSINSSDQFANYVSARAYLDSLTQLRRDMSDYSLQTGASKAKAITDTLQVLLASVNVNGLNASWKPVSDRLTVFTKDVNNSELVNLTSVGDRIKDFRQNIDNAFEVILAINQAQDLQSTLEINQMIGDRYEAYLSDFLITSKRALYRLSDADSMVLHLTENNFYCPVSGDQVKILIAPDSASIKIESPVLLDELKSKMSAIAEDVQALSSVAALQAYSDTLNSIKDKAYSIRKRLRKNTDIFIKFKEVEELIAKFGDISIYSAQSSLNELAQNTAASESYSMLQGFTESGLEGIRIFKQAYESQVFGNLDSLHKNIKFTLAEFDTLLTSVRRLPKDIVNFEQDVIVLDQLLSSVKSANDPNLSEIETSLGETYLFASEGSKVKRYGVFNKKVVNFGYIHRGTKSWEDE